MLDHVAVNIYQAPRYGSPHHRMPLTQETRIQSVLDDVAGNMYQAPPPLLLRYLPPGPQGYFSPRHNMTKCLKL